uniref:TPX2 domain-containing protein n=1 Tax=Rhabditophanes sp. KR3021 TaxID=114890 RepID=A0AC35TGD0_9BILA
MPSKHNYVYSTAGSVSSDIKDCPYCNDGGNEWKYASDLHEHNRSRKYTIPEPFNFMERPTRINTYSQRFLQKLLDEKEREEQLALARAKFYPYKASPIPKSTYMPDTSFKIGQLKRPKSMHTLSHFNNKDNTTSHDIPYKPKPVPITNYIEPTYLEEMKIIRERQKNERAIAMLLNSRSPFSMEEHEIRCRVQNKLRHQSKCLKEDDGQTKPKQSASLPDFTLLHRKEFERRRNVKKNVLLETTIVEPFKFTVEERIQKRKERSQSKKD